MRHELPKSEDMKVPPRSDEKDAKGHQDTRQRQNDADHDETPESPVPTDKPGADQP